MGGFGAGIGQEGDGQAVCIRFGHGPDGEGDRIVCQVGRENVGAVIRYQTVLRLENGFHLTGDGADLTVHAGFYPGDILKDALLAQVHFVQPVGKAKQTAQQA